MFTGDRFLRGMLAVFWATTSIGCSLLSPYIDGIGSDNHAEPSKNVRACGEDGKPEQNVKLDLIRQLMDSGKLYAALAHLDDTRSDSLQAKYLRAEILRRTDRSEQASVLYRELLDGCLAGKGFHGLGLIAGRNQRINEAIDYLQQAANELPVDVRVRNDLGYALLLGRRYDAARNEFLTALELDGGDSLAATNMLLLLSLMGKDREVRAFAVHMNIKPETIVQIRNQAEEIKASVDESNQGGMFGPTQ